MSSDAVKILLLMRSDKMIAFREAIKLSIAVLITGIVVGFIAYAGARDRFAIKLSSPSQTYFSSASDYEIVGMNPIMPSGVQEHHGITKDAARNDRN